jgi:glycosyltransferase involved in cell wall biosynthesis
VTSVIVPAHNEEKGLGRLLEALLPNASAADFEIVVVANGCTDRTVEVARNYDGVLVLETPVASKSSALRLGDSAAVGFPRLYVDADVVLSAADVRALCAAVGRPGTLAAGPSRRLALEDRPWPVHWHYDIWQRLSGVRSELYGRGVVAVSEAGHDRITRLPELMSDDLAAALAFRSDEIAIVDDAVVVIYPPRSLSDLLRRRIRAMTGTTQLENAGDHGLRGSRRTSLRELAAITGRRPWLAPKVALFLCIAVLARRRSARAVRTGNYSTWLRDESSRA